MQRQWIGLGGRVATRMIDPDALSPEKRAQILLGAAVVFVEDGYEGASMSRIAREANVSKGTLYNHFEGKADLFTAYMQQACARSMARVFENLVDDAEPEHSLREIGRRMVDMMLDPERRSIYRMVVAEAETFPELAEAFFAAGPAAAMATLARWIVAQIGRGRLAIADPDFAAEQFFALCQTRLWFRYRLHLRGAPTAAEVAQVVDGAVGMFLSCYRPPAAGA